jgi:hypothetical protein
VAADELRAYEARTRANADQFAAALEDIAENGLPSVEDCTPWEELRETHLARLAASCRLMTPQHGPRRARIAFSDAAAKQMENITREEG